MLREFLEPLLQRRSLSQAESKRAGRALINGADPHQIAAFLTLLRVKGETADEILGLLEAIRETSLSFPVDLPVLDIVGTGGDGAGTVNLSTGSALLAAACGVPVVKHGNRAISSQAGSADVLEALGANLSISPEEFKKTGFAFCFAPDYHPALKELSPIRKGLKMPTVLHLLGPLLNPAGTDHLMLGVYDASKIELLAEVLFRLGTKKSLIFHGQGIDELSCLGPTKALLVTDRGIEPLLIDPVKLGLKPCSLQDLKGGDANFNAKALKDALSGQKSSLTDTLILNAGIALFLYGKVDSMEKGMERARAKIGKKSLKAALRHGVIAEIKRASPSAGHLIDIQDPAQKALEYIDAGAMAISVLTSDRFNGSIKDLEEVAKVSTVPVLAKDFHLTKEQLERAALAGADAVLLIVAYLKEKTKQFVEIAHQLGMEALVEIHDAEELPIALASGADIIGVNQRNLKDFSMHPDTFVQLVGQIPSSQVKIAESGIRSSQEARALFAIGYDGVLVGEAFSRRTFEVPSINSSGIQSAATLSDYFSSSSVPTAMDSSFEPLRSNLALSRSSECCDESMKGTSYAS